MGVEVHARFRFDVEGIWLGGEDGEPFSATSRNVGFQFAPSTEPDDYSTEITVSGVFLPPGDVGMRLASQWPQLADDLRAYEAALEEPRQPGRRRMFPIPIGPALLAWISSSEPDVEAFFANTRREVRTSAGRLVGLLRWHFNIPSLSTPNPFDPRRRIEWSLNGDEWIKDVEGRRRPVFFDLDIGRFGVEVDDAEELISWLLDGYERESLAHELIAEAVRLGEDSPRSALVVAMTAAEVGVRSFVGSLGRADAAWLLSRPGAPPLDDLLKNYLPFVTDVRTRKGAVIPSELRRLVRRGVESRNKVVHFGEHGPDDVELEQLLTAVNDLLYILDWLAGEEWALEPVSDEWKDEYETKSDLR